MNGGNLVQGVNTCAVTFLRYSAVFISRGKCELQATDRKTRMFFYNIWRFFSFFLLGFTPRKAEQPLRGMELQEKEAQKGYRIQKICLERTYW